MLDRVRSLRVIDLGRMAYEEALAKQEECHAARVDDSVSDTLFLVEHEPVYTLGRNANPDNVLAAGGIQVVKTTRGGDVTYHGPGQVVGYPVIRLLTQQRGVVWYVGALERVLIQVLSEYGVEATTDDCNRGVWVGREKIAALGVRVSRNVTMHGFALNVTTDLSSYAGIVPCGLTERGVTSMHLHCRDVAIEDVKRDIVKVFTNVFGYTPPKR